MSIVGNKIFVYCRVTSFIQPIDHELVRYLVVTRCVRMPLMGRLNDTFRFYLFPVTTW